MKPQEKDTVVYVDKHGVAQIGYKGQVFNQVTDEARTAGAKLAELINNYAPLYYSKHPDAPSRCITCAFRKGTDANMTPDTLNVASECLITGEEFHCHHEDKLCVGAEIAREMIKRAPTPTDPNEDEL